MKRCRRPQHLRQAVLLLIGALLLAGGACRKVAPKAQQGTDAGGLWDQAETALARGDAAGAQALFKQSLSLESSIAKWRSAALALAGANRLDLAEGLLAGRNEPALTALVQAIRAYRQAPPPGFANVPFVVAAMADGLRVADAAAQATPLDRPIAMTQRDLALVAHYWQAWLYCRQVDSGGEPDGRAMVVWRLAQLASKPPPGWIVQPGGKTPFAEETLPAVLLHQGSSDMGLVVDEQLAQEDANVLPSMMAGPVQLYLAGWPAEGAPTVLVLEGSWQEGVFVVTGASDVTAFRKLAEAVADPALVLGQSLVAAGREAGAVTALAAELGLSQRLARQGQVLTIAIQEDASSEADAGAGQWLSDLMSYIRYGREGLPGNADAAIHAEK